MNELRPEHKRKAIRSYVVRGGRLTDGQRRAFGDHWAFYGLSLADGVPDWQAVFGRQAPLVLEIGFGMGGSLLTMAEAEPDKDFIGIEVHPPGVGRLINSAAGQGVENLRVYMADAVDVIDDCIPENCLSRIQIYFPDPWHKKKHHKRRIVRPAFVDKLRTRLIPGGVLHLATDWEDYAESMLAVMSGARGFTNLAPAGGFAPRPAFRPATKFERRGERLGHGVWDLLWQRHDD